ncbi:hypothetical protein WJX73_001339 [Symbiochloris irregularis]|uniref:Uncharacterized protein n=1 Tax=Symbiochloris irregularis TaxID=706552 RepID=A0AAW1NP03_9CHLO
MTPRVRVKRKPAQDWQIDQVAVLREEIFPAGALLASDLAELEARVIILQAFCKWRELRPKLIAHFLLTNMTGEHLDLKPILTDIREEISQHVGSHEVVATLLGIFLRDLRSGTMAAWRDEAQRLALA